jgi:hypothetical protein
MAEAQGRQDRMVELHIPTRVRSYIQRCHIGETMIVDIPKLDQHIEFLNGEASRLMGLRSPWADRQAAKMKDIAEILRQLRQEKQMTGIGGKSLSDNG